MDFKFNSHLISLVCLGLLSLISMPANANFPLPPRISGLAYASDYVVGQADLMLPVFANPSRNNLYVDPALSYGSDMLTSV